MAALALFDRYSDELRAWLSGLAASDGNGGGSSSNGSYGSGGGGTVTIEAWHGFSIGQLGLSVGGYPITITPPSDPDDVSTISIQATYFFSSNLRAYAFFSISCETRISPIIDSPLSECSLLLSFSIRLNDHTCQLSTLPSLALLDSTIFS